MQPILADAIQDTTLKLIQFNKCIARSWKLKSKHVATMLPIIIALHADVGITICYIEAMQISKM